MGKSSCHLVRASQMIQVVRERRDSKRARRFRRQRGLLVVVFEDLAQIGLSCLG